jgi:hypothetical protein
MLIISLSKWFQCRCITLTPGWILRIIIKGSPNHMFLERIDGINTYTFLKLHGLTILGAKPNTGFWQVTICRAESIGT